MRQVILFNQKEILVVEYEGRPYVSVRHVCDALDIPSGNQRVKISSSPEFVWHDIISQDSVSRQQVLFCILADHVHLWVAGISAAKISNPERQKQFIAYKHECARVLHEHFMQKGHDQLGITQAILDKLDALVADNRMIHEKLDHINGAVSVVFGNERELIMGLIQDVAREHGVDGRTVWGWLQTSQAVGSYKRQNNILINELRKMLGKGLQLVQGAL